MSTFVSVIVPIYNIEDCLDKCITSILNQTYTNFELILSDDGSTDGSGAIADKYAAADARVKVIHKPNGGSSSARNAAIKIAGGEYYSFIDSDDYVEPDFLEKLMEPVERAKGFGSVVPASERKPAIAPLPATRTATTGPDCMNSTSGSKNGLPWCSS